MKRYVLFVLVLAALLSLSLVTSAQSQPDTVVLTWSRQPDAMFVDYAQTSTASYSMKPVYSSLVTTDLNGQIIPELAESWELSDDQLTWTFKLRKDVKWHDGEPFTAADVKFSYEFPSDPTYTGTAFDATILGATEKQEGKTTETEGIKVIDDYTISITTTEPNALFLDTTAQRYIVPEHVLKDIPVADLGTSSQVNAPIGTGPYRVVEWKPDESIIYEAFDDYFGEKPKIKNYIWRVIPERSVQITEMLNGNIDIVPEVMPDEFPGLKEEPNITTLQLPGVNLTLILINENQPYFKDVRVRQALYYAINRQSIVDAVGAGAGMVVNSPIHPSLPEYDPNLKGYPYDPEKAKELLAEAGWSDMNSDGVLVSSGVEGLEDGTPFSVELGTLPFSPYNDSAQIVQQNLKDVGIETNLNVVEFNIYFSEYISATSDYQLAMSGWFNLLFPPQGELEANYKSDGSNTQWLHWSNQEVDNLLVQATTTFDAAERNKLYYRIQEIVLDEAPAVFLTRLDNLIAYNKNLIVPEVGSLNALFDSIPQWEWAQ